MRTTLERRAREERRGSAMVMTMVTLSALAMTATALVATSISSSGLSRVHEENTRASYVAEAGLAQAVASLRTGGNGVVGSVQNPVAYGDGRFWVTREDVAADVVRLTATGVENRDTARVELTLRRRVQSLWAYGAFGDQSLHLDSNSRVDSYDAELGTYASQAVNSSGSSQYAHTDGDVGSNGSVLIEQNAKVWGDAACGPSATTSVLGNAVVTGSTAPASNTVALPEISVPSLTSLGNKNVVGTLTLAPGDYRYDTLQLKNNAVLDINGPATLVVSNFILRSGSKCQIKASGGKVTVYVLDDFIVNSNTLIAADDSLPANVEFKLISDNVIDPNVVVDLDEIDFDSNAQMYGTIYAPNAHIEVDSNFELFGAMVAHSIDLDSNSRVHYDESLVDAMGNTAVVWERVCWRPLAD